MVPAKSISFFLMLTESRLKIDKTIKCRTCQMNKCQYRIEGVDGNLTPHKEVLY